MTSFPALAGDDVKVSGEVEYFAPLTMSPAMAREQAIENAQAEVLRNAFGSTLSRSNIMVDRVTDGHSDTRAFSLSESNTNGEWIRDLEDPEITTVESAHGIIYRVKVKGLARKITREKIDLDVRLLCNGTDKDRDLLRGRTYYVGDNFYLYFNSPVSGWLAVYLGDDDEEMTMQAILPYDGQKEKAYPIEADREYVFFSRTMAEPQYVDVAGGLKMYARNRTDINTIYVIFSPNEFSRTSTSENKSELQTTRIAGETVNLMPRETNLRKFKKWLAKNRSKDPQMQVSKFIVEVSKP